MNLCTVVGIGPGNAEQLTLRARRAMEQADLLCGYTLYLDLVRDLFPDKETISSGMKQERRRCQAALDAARSGKRVCVLCSGDAGVYGMATLLLELLGDDDSVEIEVVPGITAALSGGALLGAPLAHDFCVISLSDLLTPWEQIEQRLRAAAMGDFCIALYNPSSKKRADYLARACGILLETLDENTVCGVAQNIGREGERAWILPLKDLQHEALDMFCTVFIGNSQTKQIQHYMVTPRGYLKR